MKTYLSKVSYVASMDNGESLKRGPDGAESAEGPGASIGTIARVFVRSLGKLILVGIATASLLFVFLMATFKMPPFDLDKLEQLKPGMRKAEVKLVLGDPSTDEDKSKFQWTYAGWGWPMVHIYFDVNERFESSEYDY